jgi:outer membrane protein OmpA-like peptidoglycan-associated protein
VQAGEGKIRIKETVMKKHRIPAIAGALALIVIFAATGCVTKKYVQTEMAAMDKKVEGVETSVEENQKRIKEHDERLVSIGSLITQHDSQFVTVDGKIEDVKKMVRGDLIMKESLKSSDAKFKFNSAELSPEAKLVLDKFVETLIALNRGVYIEIQGHTDKTGEESINLILGKKRADAVMEYLYKTHHIPLHRMQTISFGSSVPVAENNNRDGRAQNRRVDILVYE